MKAINERIEEIKTKGYNLDFSSVFNLAFENYKKIAVYAGSMLLVFMVLLFSLIAGILVSIIGLKEFISLLKPENLRPEKMSDEFIYIYTCSSMLLTAIISPFFAGIIKMTRCAQIDEEFQVSSVFQYYKAPYFKEIFGATLFISLFNFLISLLLNYSGNQSISLVISLVISLLTVLTIPLIIFANQHAISGIKNSVIIVSKQPLMFILLITIAFLGAMVGFVGCFFGLFFTIPFIYSMHYALYNTIIGFD